MDCCVVVNITQPHVNRHFAESKFCVIINGAKMNETWSTLALNFSEAMSFEFVAPPGEANVTLFKNTEAVYGSLPSFRFDMRNYLRFHGVAVRSVESAVLCSKPHESSARAPAGLVLQPKSNGPIALSG